jgi:diguanylate cyclase (GGDEF)-like protein/PAS domain S-box-containing protein
MDHPPNDRSKHEAELARLKSEIERLKGVEARLKESEERLRFVTETTGGALYRLRYDDMTYDYLSPAIERLTGYTASEINLMGFKSLIQSITKPAAEELAAEEILRVRLAGETGEYNADYLIKTKDGQRRWLADHSLPWLDADGVIIGSVGVLTDITERKRLEDSLRVMATIDHLTGLLNRGCFLEMAERELHRSQRYGSPLSLIMLDVDHFKQVNDAHGHAMGDRVLESLAQACADVLRDSDLLGRIGGEEFAACLVECKLERAKAVGERLRLAVESLKVEDNQAQASVTISLGAAQAQEDEDLAALMRRADQAMYEAKRAGRNRLALALNEPNLPLLDGL